LHAVGKAVGKYGQVASVIGSSGVSASTISDLKLAATGVLAAIRPAQADPPPACVPGLRSAYTAALSDFAGAAHNADRAVQALQANEVQAAVKDIQASGTTLVAGARAIEKTNRDITRFESRK
jgi:hypothetical protein